MKKYNFLLILLVCLSINGLHSSDQSNRDIIKKAAKYFVFVNTALYTAGAGAVVGMTKALGGAPLKRCIPSMKSMQKDVSKVIIKKMPLTGALSVGAAVMHGKIIGG